MTDLLTQKSLYQNLEQSFGISFDKYEISDDPGEVLEFDKTTHIKNPFFVTIDEGNTKRISRKELCDKYKRVLVLSRKNTEEKNDSVLMEFMDNIISYEFLRTVGEMFTLSFVNISILRHSGHYRDSKIISREFLEAFNSNSLELNEEEIVLFMGEQPESEVRKYTNLYNNWFDFKTVIDMKSIANYNATETYFPISSKLSMIMRNVKETTYWENIYNCMLSFTSQYKNRNMRLKNKIIATSLEYINELKTSYTFNHSDLNKSSYVDGSSANGILTTYYQSKSSDITKESINSYFRMTSNNKELFEMFNTLLISKNYCHLVLNNSTVLEIMEPIIKKCLPLYRYLFGYAWTCMYMEESITKTRTVKTDRYVFDIETANKLPYFPYLATDLRSNPYLPILVSDKEINSDNNCLGLKQYLNFDNYGISTLADFERKFNLFATRDSKLSLFTNMDWSSLAICGSVMSACVPKESPLLGQFTTGVSEDENLLMFFEEYYQNSDIDMMCNEPTVFGFMDRVNHVYTTIGQNLNSQTGKKCKININSHTSCRILVSKKYYEIISPIEKDVLVSDFLTDSVKQELYKYYMDIKLKKNIVDREYLKLNPKSLSDDYLKLVEMEDVIYTLIPEITNANEGQDTTFTLRINDILEDKVSEEDNHILIQIDEGLKFKINSSSLQHSIEIFRTKYLDFFSCVSKFHLPCVRSYYDGANIYLLPSCISAYMTGINIDYKYFAGKNNPIEILNKYRMRGFGTLLNEKEKISMVEYICSDAKWNSLLPVDLHNKDSINALFGTLSSSHTLFKPRSVLEGLPVQIYTKLKYQYYSNSKDLDKYYAKKSGYHPKKVCVDYNKLKTIDGNGNLIPIKKWVLEAGAELLI